ncbi:glycosyl hydrolase family 65 [Niabella ginsenosidivorans]|uniref:Glycosyl hydrolase family 65 n=1 Tax=Niabella ginsenosidivorans TaxID=1176587 RepID=A0A1A9I8B1_9BACT|nr:glycosyl hydrolase family 65 [Niabella ginsenosidivorans]
MKRTIVVFLMFSSVQIHAQLRDGWTITASNIDPNNYYGITVANGMIGLVSSPEPMQVKDVVMNGVYDYYQRGRVSNILKIFNHINLSLSINGISASKDNIFNYRQSLNMKKAELITDFDIADAHITHKLMSLRHLPYTSLAVVEIKAKKEVVIAASSMIEAPDHLREIRNLYSEIDPHIPLLTSVAKSPSGKITLAASSSIIFPEPRNQQPVVTHGDWDYNRHLMRFSKKIKTGETYRFAIVASATSTVQYKDPHNEAERLTIFANLEGIQRLLEKHEAAWEALWKSDIVVEGDEEVQRAIHAALYHLYSFSRAGTAYSPSPMGLSGLGYNGHVFWDSELWMYPPLLVLHPNIAKSMLEYRFQRLNAAKQNAFAHGYKGAMFPWESSDGGSEDTPVWALTGPFQHHITGDVGWAFWKYYQVTKDKTWLRERGYPILKEVADFWASRVERKGPGNYEINNVIGANEWQENIDNNAFTNGIAITTLRYATQAAKELGIQPNSDWNHVADNIPILKFPNGVTRENASYNGVDIKQADVNLLAYPLEIVSDTAQIEKDLSYYEPKMSPEGPAMGNATLATLYSRLGNARKADELFRKSYKPNEMPPFGVLAETQGGTNPYFATGAGGMLQAVIFGFGGLQISDQGIVQRKTALPVKWKSLTIKGAGILKKDFVNHN